MLHTPLAEASIYVICAIWLCLGVLAYLVLDTYRPLRQFEYIRHNPDMGTALALFIVGFGLLSFAALVMVMICRSVRQEFRVFKHHIMMETDQTNAAIRRYDLVA